MAKPRKKTVARKKRTATGSRSAAAAADIQGWSTDPMGGLPPLQLSAPDLPGATLPTRIIDPAQAPPPRIYVNGTAEFRFWTAAEALRRCAEFWREVGVAAWNPDIGTALPVRLDDGVDLNAYYARNDFPPQDIKQGLSFFHDTVMDVATGQRVTVFSGESPDVVAHELGHAVLDALKPALWGLATTEAAAFHEGLGDMSAILTALQLPAVRQAVLEETSGRLWRNSSVSRVAEQLGYAIRQRNPAGVDRDSLRNASNSFVYVDPTTLPPQGPASGLSRASHNFSRIFTGAFLEALGGMVLQLAESPGPEDVLEASFDMGRLLARAVVNAPVRTRFFQAVAEQLVLADSSLFNGKYAEPLTAALVRRGLLPIRALATPSAAAAGTPARAAAAAAKAAASIAGGGDQGETVASEPIRMTLDGASVGLPVSTLYVEAPAVDDSPVLSLGIAESGPRRLTAVQAFVEGLIIRGRVTVGPRMAGVAPLVEAMSQVESTPRHRLTHQLVGTEDGVELQRLIFDCGCRG
jgi:hypothetical protein